MTAVTLDQWTGGVVGGGAYTRKPSQHSITFSALVLIALP